MALRAIYFPSIIYGDPVERVQKSSMRTIFGNKYESYEDSLNQLKLDTLEVRKEKLCLSLAKKSLQLEKFKQLFPLNMNRHTRNSNKFIVRKCRTERHRNSSIPFICFAEQALQPGA